MNNKPFFSIVLPTLNRAQYIPFAIRSILDQTYGNFELIISNNNSSDETEEIIQSFDDPRIVYFKTDETLSSVKHWEFALSKARGEFITFLGDDDANSIATLELVKEALNEQPDCRLLGWQLCQYYWDDHNDPEAKILKNNLAYAPFSGQLSKRDSKQTIRDIFASHGLCNDQNRILSFEIPSLVNAVYHHSLIFDANAAEMFFSQNCASGDRYNAIISLDLVNDFYYLDYPLHLHGFSKKSGTATIDGARNSFQHSSEEMLTKIRCFTHRNYSANALLHAKNDLGEKLDYIEIDWLRFFIETFNDLILLKRKGFQVDNELQDFGDVLVTQPTDFQEKFQLSLPSIPRAAFEYLVYQTKNVSRPVYRYLSNNSFADSVRQRINKAFYIYVSGQDGRFSDILECAQMISKDWLEDNINSKF